jgi:alanine dehydrogenase
MKRQTLILTSADVADLLPIEECVAVVEQAFAAGSRSAAGTQAMLGVHVSGGAFHVKAAVLDVGDGRYFVSKTNANYPGNPASCGLPTIQGILVLADAETGFPLAVMDSTRVTELRTAAATGVAARRLAWASSSVVTIVGCGRQGRAHLRVLAKLFRLTRCFAMDVDDVIARAFAADMSSELALVVEPVPTVRAGSLRSDICVTCTSSARPVLGIADVRPGSFVAAVGADNPSKQEIEPDLLARSRVVVDSLEQCRRIGDLSSAIRAGVVGGDDDFVELGTIVDGRAPGRTSDDETIVFDSTGTAFQDVAAAVFAFQRALETNRGLNFSFDAPARTPPH